MSYLGEVPTTLKSISVTSNYTISKKDNGLLLICNNSSDITLSTSIAIANLNGLLLQIYNANTGTVTFDPYSSETIGDTSTSITVVPGQRIVLYSNGTKWSDITGIIVDSTITGTKLVDGTITGSKLANGTITNTQIADGTITPSKFSTVYPFTNSFTSVANTLVAYTNYPIAHGLGATPKLINSYAVCITADADYTVGTKLELGSHPVNFNSTNSYGYNVTSDATNLNVCVGMFGPTVIDNSNHSPVTLNLTKWQFYFQAFV
jgi:hypothetical protein